MNFVSVGKTLKKILNNIFNSNPKDLLQKARVARVRKKSKIGVKITFGLPTKQQQTKYP